MRYVIRASGLVVVIFVSITIGRRFPDPQAINLVRHYEPKSRQIGTETTKSSLASGGRPEPNQRGSIEDTADAERADAGCSATVVESLTIAARGIEIIGDAVNNGIKSCGSVVLVDRRQGSEKIVTAIKAKKSTASADVIASTIKKPITLTRSSGPLSREENDRIFKDK